MPLKVAINGFGRIGRSVFRVGLRHPEIEFVAINDDLAGPANLAYLLRYDSVHGRFHGNVEAVANGRNALKVNGRLVACLAESAPERMRWREVGVDYVIEASDRLLSAESSLRHLEAGAARVLITAPTRTPGVIPTFVPGVNLHQFHQKSDPIVSLATASTNCLAPLAQVMHDGFGIAEGLVSAIQSVTADQATVDSPREDDFRGGRSILDNIIPAPSGTVESVGRVIPELRGKLSGLSLRVPVGDVSLIDFTVRTEKGAKYADVCAAMQQASETSLRYVLGYTEDPVVSTDFRTCSYSAVFDASASLQLSDRFFKLLAWYDNEWGYAARVVDMLKYMATADRLL